MAHKETKKKVTFKLHAPSAHEVLITESFRNRRETARPLKRCKDGTWRITIGLNPGFHEYHFIVDGVRHDDPGSTTRRANGFGVFNCVVWV